MQSVTTAYKNSMKSPLRNRGFIKVAFGVFSQEAQAAATISNLTSEQTYFSDPSRIFADQQSNFVYATLEEDFCKVDGSMRLLPQLNHPELIQPTGLICDTLVSSGTVSVIVNFGGQSFTWYGLTVDFGENYPVEFDIRYGNEVIEVSDNDSAIYRCEHDFQNVSSLTFVFHEMLHPATRVRIYNILFGLGYIYYNEDVISSSLSRIASPTSEYVPQFDFSVVLKNYDHYFDIDNPHSVINYFRTDMDVSVSYGYDTDGEGNIEWVTPQRLKMADWKNDDKTVTIYCQDILRNLDGECSIGSYQADNWRTFKSLAEEVLSKAGIPTSMYYLDPVLAQKTTGLPIPRQTYKESLQQIANACGCVLTVGRNGRIEIRRIAPTDSPVDFTMETIDILGSPMVSKREAVKSITIQYEHWFEHGDEELLITDSFNAQAGESRTYYVSDPVYQWRVVVNGTTASSQMIADGGSYFLVLQFDSAGTKNIEVYAHRYDIVTSVYTYPVNSVGREIIWHNPLVNGITVAGDLVAWLARYYNGNIEYDYDTRGNPELDVCDIIKQENDYISNMKVLIEEYVLDFNGAFSGRVKTVRLGVS